MRSHRLEPTRVVAALAIIALGVSLLDASGLPVLTTFAFPALLLATGLVCMAGWLIATRAGPDEPLDLRLLDAGLIGLALVAALGLILGTAGWLSFRSLVFSVGVGALAVIGLAPRRGEPCVRPPTSGSCSRPLTGTEPGEHKVRPYVWSVSLREMYQEFPHRAILSLVAGLVAFAVAQAVLGRVLRPPVGDPLAYHLPFAVKWLQSGSLAMPVPAAGDPSTPFYPLNSSLWMFWMLAPFESEILARYVQLPFLLLLGLAAFRLGLEIGLGRRAAFVASALAVTVPDIARSASLPENDLILAALLVTATAFLARLWSQPTCWRAAMGALALGLAAGTKVLALPFVGLLGIAWIVIVILRWRTEGLRTLGAVLATGTGLFLALGGYSYVRNAVVMDNPLYPSGYVVAGRELFEGLYVMSWEWRRTHAFFPFDWSGFLLGMRRSFGWTVTWWVLPGLALAAGLAARGSIRLLRNQGQARAARLLLLPVALILWVPLTLLIFWFVIPYHFARFLFPTIVWGIVAATWGFDALIRLVGRRFSIPADVLPLIALPFLTVNVLNMPLNPSIRETALYWVAAVVVVGGVAGFAMVASMLERTAWSMQSNPRRCDSASRPRTPPVIALGDPPGRPYRGFGSWKWVRTLALIASLLTVLAAIIAWPLYESEYEARRFDEWRSHLQAFNELAGAWEWIDQQTEGESAVIAVAGTNEIYPLYGDDLDNRVVTIWHSGELAAYGWGEPFTLYREPDRAAWLRRIEKAGVDYVYITENVSFGGWPVEREWMMSDSGRFERVYRNADVEIWAVRPGGDAGYTVPLGIG